MNKANFLFAKQKIIAYIRADNTIAVNTAEPPGCLAVFMARLSRVAGYVAIGGLGFVLGYILGYVK